jgi:steroid 5-alpha reductase family enzyme
MNMRSHGKLVPLFVLLISVLFLLKGLDVFDQNFVDIVWPVLLGITALISMSGHK